MAKRSDPPDRTEATLMEPSVIVQPEGAQSRPAAVPDRVEFDLPMANPEAPEGHRGGGQFSLLEVEIENYRIPHLPHRALCVPMTMSELDFPISKDERVARHSVTGRKLAWEVKYWDEHERNAVLSAYKTQAEGAMHLNRDPMAGRTWQHRPAVTASVGEGVE